MEKEKGEKTSEYMKIAIVEKKLIGEGRKKGSTKKNKETRLQTCQKITVIIMKESGTKDNAQKETEEEEVNIYHQKVVKSAGGEKYVGECEMLRRRCKRRRKTVQSRKKI